MWAPPTFNFSEHTYVRTITSAKQPHTAPPTCTPLKMQNGGVHLRQKSTRWLLLSYLRKAVLIWFNKRTSPHRLLWSAFLSSLPRAMVQEARKEDLSPLSLWELHTHAFPSSEEKDWWSRCLLSKPGRGCEVMTKVGELNDHKNVCGFVNVVCTQGCGRLIYPKYLAEHCSNFCPKRMMTS